MPTLQDVAQRAGVSTATVSKVLSNTPYFTDETREKVMKAVRELGYIPNLAARALSSGRTHIITVVFPYIYDTIFKDPLVMSIIEGIEAVCSEAGYNLLLSAPRLTAEDTDENYHKLVRSGYIDGLIAIDNVPSVSVAATALQHQIPTVVLGHHAADFFVRSDEGSGGEQIMRHVLELGHRQIGIITVPEDMNLAINERVNGLRRVMEGYNLDFTALPLTYGNFSATSGAAAADALITRHPDLTALICINDRMALGAIQKLREMGRRIPEDVSVVGYDNIAISRLASPSVTTVDQKPVQLGLIAARMMMDVLNGASPESVVLPVELVIRESTAAPNTLFP